MPKLEQAIADGIAYLDWEGFEVPVDVRLRAHALGAVKAAGDLASIYAAYHDAITGALTDYFEGGSMAGPKNAFKRAAVENLGAAFDLGWSDGGGELPADGDALDWFNARIQQETGFIDQLFENAKALRKEEGADTFGWTNEHADQYTMTVSDIYNMGKMFASKNKMLTFTGEDGRPDNICQRTNGTCVKLKGQRHRASWWIAHDLVPYRGNPNYDCGAWECRHYLEDDDGNKFII